ncbi:hypothetical protein HDU98_004963 [Podochytrium sp. JEL0797]|nr:hypothetical protein HDU98_004963 [Podochytrium sp. JEL0797]
MKFLYAVLAFAASSFAQNSTVAPAAPSAPSAASSSSKSAIEIISPTGTKSYNSGDLITITWSIVDTTVDSTQQLVFEICDASLGANKVTPIGVTLNGTASISALQLNTELPKGIPAGGAYTIRADLKESTSFVYFFSPNFPINQALGVSVPVATSAGAAAAATGSNGSPAAVTKTSAVATTATSGALAYAFGGVISAAIMFSL